jgi:hypothetical protein
MRALVAGSSCSGQLHAVDSELREIVNVSKVHLERRKHLLQVLHATRALDTALGTMLAGYGIAPVPHSIGPRLSKFGTLPAGHAGYLAQNTIGQFKRSICGPRNDFIHKADAFPRSFREADRLVSAIESCFAMTIK